MRKWEFGVWHQHLIICGLSYLLLMSSKIFFWFYIISESYHSSSSSSVFFSCGHFSYLLCPLSQTVPLCISVSFLSSKSSNTTCIRKEDKRKRKRKGKVRKEILYKTVISGYFHNSLLFLFPRSDLLAPARTLEAGSRDSTNSVSGVWWFLWGWLLLGSGAWEQPQMV